MQSSSSRECLIQQFLDDKKTFNAVVRAVEVIGEAAKNVRSTIPAQYPAIPWKEMAGMRDKVTHFYFSGSTGKRFGWQ
ncbi:MAG: hypothetical protein K0S58_591 [Nitrospira sp.]|nr:hypothetical protein [Nitrospira sp.]